MTYLVIFSMTALGFGQAPSVATSSCTIGHRMVTPKNPQTGPDGNFLPGQSIVQLGSALYDETTIRVIEHPMSAKDDLDAYRSTIVVTQRNMRQEYSLAQHIKYGSLYRIVEFASFCPSPDREIVYLAFETPSTGASEAFVVLQLLPEGIDFHALPEANEGRIVIRTSDPTRVELWSATGNADRTGCDACGKYYSIQDCEIEKHTITCNHRAGAKATGYPGKFISRRIEIH